MVDHPRCERFLDFALEKDCFMFADLNEHKFGRRIFFLPAEQAWVEVLDPKYEFYALSLDCDEFIKSDSTLVNPAKHSHHRARRERTPILLDLILAVRSCPVPSQPLKVCDVNVGDRRSRVFVP